MTQFHERPTEITLLDVARTSRGWPCLGDIIRYSGCHCEVVETPLQAPQTDQPMRVGIIRRPEIDTLGSKPVIFAAFDDGGYQKE